MSDFDDAQVFAELNKTISETAKINAETAQIVALLREDLADRLAQRKQVEADTNKTNAETNKVDNESKLIKTRQEWFWGTILTGNIFALITLIGALIKYLR